MHLKSRTVLGMAVLGLALGALGSAAALAQDQQRPDEQAHHDQDRRDDQARHDAGDHAGADVERYRKAHPHAAARCHDGFFTNTTDRNRACSKHGGIDTWLRE